MARFVVYDSEKQKYLMPRGSYWERKDRADQNRGDCLDNPKPVYKAGYPTARYYRSSVSSILAPALKPEDYMNG